MYFVKIDEIVIQQNAPIYENSKTKQVNHGEISFLNGSDIFREFPLLLLE
jgi:hypothetical protein